MQQSDVQVACPVFVSRVGCDVSVGRFTEARAVPGAVLARSWMLLCPGSKL